MNIAISFQKLNNFEKYEDILLFCYENVDSEELLIKISYNLGTLYGRKNSYKKCLEYANLSLELSQKKLYYDILPQIYYLKFLSEYNLNIKNEYIKSINYSIVLAITYGNDFLKEYLIQKKEKFKINTNYF